ncbi:MAG: low affinity iron permease family protein [Candidatus Nomurabacteria bacterium]|nr:MAG: low affinity iron permease family protein [Candidatus Nomurabacteria bacterium]
MKNTFRIAANRISVWTGSAIVFLGAVAIVIIWALTGPIFHYSDTWQLVINTGTTIITFLMVFLIQNTQNRDSKAVQLKLDELIRATKGARTTYVGLEDLSDTDLEELEKEFKLLVQNPGTVRALNKLHARIEAENARRMSLRGAASRMLHHTQTVTVVDDAELVKK